MASRETVYLYVQTPLGDKFLIEEIAGEERISGLFHYRLRLRSEDGNIAFSQIVGKSATVTITQYNGEKRYINGVVSRFIHAGSDGIVSTYYAELRPWPWLLTLTSNSKIFQNQSLLDIVKAVFSDAGLTDFSDQTVGNYQPRQYCVQYQETAFAFVSRLMEEAGIFYFFQHFEDKHLLILADDPDAHVDCPGLEYARMRYASQEDRLSDDYITQCSYEQQMVPTRYAADDFNFQTPSTDLLSRADGRGEGSFRIYEYPAIFENTGQGESVADRRMEALELDQTLLSGEGGCRAFIAGYRFRLREHERADLNSDYVIKTLSVRADQRGYSNSFEAFPADRPFRPSRLTRKPRIVGTQTAIVTGKKGEEIWPDQYGRVKVQFHWDQEGRYDENTSCWVRVAQGWAGKGWGAMFIPRIGMEVIVSFLEGDPDRPIITGTVYNAEQTIPYAMPGDKTRSSLKTNSSMGGGGFNEIRFEDKKGEEEFFTHAQKDQNEVVENNMSTTVKANQSLSVGGNQSIVVEKARTTRIKKQDDKLTVVRGNREIEISQGNETHTNQGNFTHRVHGNFVLKVSGNLTIDVSGIATIKGALIKLNP